MPERASNPGCGRGGERRGRGPSGLAPGSEVPGVERKGGEEAENGGRELARLGGVGGELGALELGKVLWSKKALEVREWPCAGLRTGEEQTARARGQRGV